MEMQQLRNGIRKGSRLRPSLSHSEAISDGPATCLTRRVVARNLWSMNLAFLLCSTAVTGMTVSRALPLDITTALGLKLVASVAGCVLLTPVMVHIVGCKWTMLVSGTMLLLWVLSGVVPTSQSSYVTALLTSLAMGPLFTALATQLVRNARRHAALTHLPGNTCVARFCGVFFAMLHLGIALGYMAPLVIASLRHNTSVEPARRISGPDDLWSDSFQPPSGAVPDFYDIVGPHCGANFCPYLPSLTPESILRNANVTFEVTTGNRSRHSSPKFPQYGMTPNNTVISDHALRIQYYVQTGAHSLLLIGCLLILGLGLHEAPADPTPALPATWYSEVLGMGKQCQQLTTLCLIPLNIYIGYSQSFAFSELTGAYVSCVAGQDEATMALAVWALAASVLAGMTGLLTPCAGRRTLLSLAFLGRVVVSMWLVHWVPAREELPIVFGIVVAWGAVDGCFAVHMHALYSDLFQSHLVRGFAAYRLLESLGIGTGYCLNSLLCVSQKLYMQLGLALVAIAGYYAAECLHTRGRMWRNDPTEETPI